MATTASSPASSGFKLTSLLHGLIIAGVVAYAAYEAYRIRLYAIEIYGRVIHEFDPWFNMRATQYLADNGVEKFFKWFDHESWYPLGRPVGTTIYPGMQFTAVGIWQALKSKIWMNWFGLRLKMSLNDVCVFIPAWFGSIASVTTGLLTREVSGSWNAAAAATAVMAVLPAHLMRSVGGAYDNESVAMSAMCLTFFLWCRSLRTPKSWPFGILAGLAYFYMVATWGGFTFVCNMIGIHAAALVALGYNSPNLHKAYSLWYIVGTLGAIQVPVVNWSPFRSMEQLGPLVVFIGLQFLYISQKLEERRGFTWEDNKVDILKQRATAAAVAVVPIAILAQLDFFGPFSVRIKSLFIKHTKTGNPLVDSVAEHQPASEEAYYQFLHYALFLYLPGIILLLFKAGSAPKREYAGVQVTKYFMILYGAMAYYFASKMVRLIILMAPVASALAGVAIAFGVEWAIAQFFEVPKLAQKVVTPAADATEAAPADATVGTPSSKKNKKAALQAAAADDSHVFAMYGLRPLIPMAKTAASVYASKPALVVRVLGAVFLLFLGVRSGLDFWRFADVYAERSSQPSIKFKARLNTGQEVMINDYLDAYHWLRDNTPADSRVLSWWDYGYQIAGIGNRTTLADGNTWNLEHIATIGRILTAPEKKAHSLARYLADYVLVWAGNQGDDLAKSPHMARIASSVYPDVCVDDPSCRNFGFYAERKPTPSMAASMLYKMHSNGVVPGVTLNPKLFKEVHTSKYGLVRIYQVLNISTESKEWLADPANRLCDAPGSWYCVGQYPPGFPKPPK